MKKIILLGIVFCLITMRSSLYAQSINNRNWTTYISDPINDTVTFHIRSDSSFITNSKGAAVVHNQCAITHDTLTVVDFGTEEQGCPEMRGKYRISLAGNSFTLALISDDCDGRAHVFAERKWTETPMK